MSDVNTAQANFDAILARLHESERADFLRATYFILEANDDCSLAPLEEANDYSLHIGLPDRPPHRYVLEFADLEDGLLTFEDLKKSHPNAALWLSSEEMFAPIEGDNIWIGAVKARAAIDPTDTTNDWNELAEAIVKAETKGSPIVVVTTDFISSVVETVAKNI
jgi:hypothetical protein